MTFPLLADEPVTRSGPTLRPYQRDMLDAIVAASNPGAGMLSGQNRLLCKAPTGTGKTVSFAAMLQWPALKVWMESFHARERRMLVIAHREELLDQAAAKIRAQNPGLMVSIEQGERHANTYSDVVIASIQTLSAMQCRRLHRLLKPGPFRLVIVDEAHHAAADSYRTALAHLGFLPLAVATDKSEAEAASFDDVAEMQTQLAGWDDRAPKDRLLVGVTATPNRSDSIGLGCVFQTIAYAYGLKDAIADGYLVPIKPWVIETADNLDKVRTTAGDFNQKDLASTVNNPKRNLLALDSWKLHAKDQSTIAFTVDVQHAHDLAEMFAADGIAARAVSGKTPTHERQQTIADFTAGKVKVITNCAIFTEGTDLPIASCILHCKPTKSATLYEQMTGRGLRLYPGKEACIVIDLVDVARKHSLQAAPVLYGLPPGVKTAGDDLRKTVADLDALREKNPRFDVDGLLTNGRYSVKELLDRASTFDIWTVPKMGALGEGLVMNWIRFGDDRFRLQYPWQDGTEVLEVSKDVLGHFELVATLRPPMQPVRQRTLATQVQTASEALILAEVFIQRERHSVRSLTASDAPWRQKRPSEKALAFARKMGVPITGTETAGQISDRIDMAKARRGMR